VKSLDVCREFDHFFSFGDIRGFLITQAEALQMSDLTVEEFSSRSFIKILEHRRKP